MSDLIKEELNIKEVLMTENEDELVEVVAKANFRAIGKKYGKKVKEIAKEIQNLPTAELKKVEKGETIIVCDEEIILDDLFIQHNQKEGIFAETEGDITVSLDVDITETLLSESFNRKTDNTMAKRERAKGQTTISKS